MSDIELDDIQYVIRKMKKASVDETLIETLERAYLEVQDEIARLRAALRDVYIYVYNYANGLEDNLGDLQDMIWESGLFPKEELQELHDKYSGGPGELEGGE